MTHCGALINTQSETCTHCTTVLVKALGSLHSQPTHHCTARSLLQVPLCHIGYSLVFWVKDSILWLSNLVE